MKVLISLLVIVIFVLNVLSFIEAQQEEFSITRNISQSVIEICRNIKAKDCDPYCNDGFSEDCYYHSNEVDRSELKGDFTLSHETKEKCFGIHSYSACGNCINKFELRKSDHLQKVSCEEFFQVIEEKNTSCDHCLDVFSISCC